MKNNSVALVSGAPGFSNKIAMKNLIDIQKEFHAHIHIYRFDPPGHSSSDEDQIVFHTLKKPWGKGDNLLLRILGILYMEIHSLLILLKIPKEVSYIFFLQSTQLFIPALFFLKGRAKIIKITTRDYSKRNIRPFLEMIYSLSDKIIVFTPSMINKLDIARYKNKIQIFNYNYVGNNFKINKPNTVRKEFGYIGRLAPEKNIGSIIEAGKILGMKDRLLIGGDGQSLAQVREMCKREDVKFIGKIPHHKMPEYLNRMKILILPSDTEGFPKIVTEAMACGTIVLATPVGGIEDVLIDGETGFILNEKRPEYIADKIKDILKRDDLDEISSKAREKIIDLFSYEKAVQSYKMVIDSSGED